MEDLLKLLKKLKMIEPDKNYTVISRQKILDEANKEKVLVFEAKNKFSLMKVFRSFSLVFATFIIVLGLFLIIRDITPKFEVLNPSVIKAEADAIDFQIQLSKLIYSTPNSPKILNSILNKKSKTEDKITQSTTTTTTTANTSSIIESITPAEKITVDEVLDYIAK